MKRIKNILTFLLIALLVITTSCQSKLVGHQIIGVWEHGNSRIEFKTNGYFYKGNEKYKFTVNENKVTIDNNGEAMVVDYSINPNGTLSFNELIYYPIG